MAKKNQIVATKRQIAALTNSTRGDIFQRLASLGPLSVKQIADGLNLPVSSLYHHLQNLVAVGLIEAVRLPLPDGAMGRPPVVYDAIARVALLSEEIDKPGHAKLVGRAARAAAAQASRDFNAAIGKPASVIRGSGKNTAFFRTLMSPSPSELARIDALLAELRELTSKSNRGSGQLITIAWFMAPVRRMNRPHRRPAVPVKKKK